MEKQELADARKAIEDALMVEKIEILALSEDPVRTANGGVIDEYESIGTRKCRIQMRIINLGESDVAERVSGTSSYVIKLPWNSPVTRSSRLQKGDTVFDVEATNGHQTERLALECYCNLIT